MISIKGLTVDFGSVKALDDVWLTIRTGEIVAIVGANGSGKTTMARCITGLQKPTQGRVLMDNLDCWKNREEIWAKIDFLEAQQHLPESHNAIEAIMLFCPELNSSQARQKAEKVFHARALNLPQQHYSRPISQLSHGMRQKVLVATLREVPYWFLDEPTQGFDPNISDNFRDYIIGQDRTVVWITHNMGDAERADRLIILHQGRVVASGPPAVLKAWLDTPSLEEVYSHAASDDCRFICETRWVMQEGSLPPGTFYCSTLDADQIVVEGASYSKRMFRIYSDVEPGVTC